VNLKKEEHKNSRTQELKNWGGCRERQPFYQYATAKLRLTDATVA